jgi:hypothetical protein
MELTEKLKSTLENTYSLALKLEEVSSMIIPKKIGERGRKRLININRELKNFYSVSKTKDKVAQLFQKPVRLRQALVNKTVDFRNDYTSSKVKKNLSISIREVNQRVKLCRAGKSSVAKCMSARRTGFESLPSEGSPKHFLTEVFDEKPQPYICLTNGKIEDPITLPTFDEFLLSKGEDFNKRGKDELFYRIDRATEQISRFKEHLQSKNFGKVNDEKVKMTKQTSKNNKKEEDFSKFGKKNDLKALMNQYFNMPCVYDSPKIMKRHSSATPCERTSIINSEAEEALESTLRSFNCTKAVENRKILDILEKIRADRPKVMKQKIILIQSDREKYKNKHHSIEKFKHFREVIEKSKREDQFKIYQQGLVYLEILDEYKRRRHKPIETELLILGFWKKIVESGSLITQAELDEIVNIVSPFDSNNKDIQSLLEKLSSSLNV